LLGRPTRLKTGAGSTPISQHHGEQVAGGRQPDGRRSVRRFALMLETGHGPTLLVQRSGGAAARRAPEAEFAACEGRGLLAPFHRYRGMGLQLGFSFSIDELPLKPTINRLQICRPVCDMADQADRGRSCHAIDKRRLNIAMGRCHPAYRSALRQMLRACLAVIRRGCGPWRRR
jgi:hypothetical protein